MQTLLPKNMRLQHASPSPSPESPMPSSPPVPLLSYEQVTFTTGQSRLRPHHSHHRNFTVNKKRYPNYAAAASSLITLNGASRWTTGTRNKVLATILIVCVFVLAISYNSVFSHGKTDAVAQTPMTDLRDQIKAATPTTTSATPTETPRQLNQILTTPTQPTVTPPIPPSIATDAHSTLPSVDPRLHLLQSELNYVQSTNAQLKKTLEATEKRLAQAELDAKKAAESAAAMIHTVQPTTQVSTAVALTNSLGKPIEVPSYPPIAISASKKYSKFFCIGGRGRLDAHQDRSCRFQNICYRPKTDEWVFYQDPKEKLVVLLDQGKIIEEFGAQFLNLRSMGRQEDARFWAPKIEKSEAGIPVEAFVPRTNPAKPGVHILYHPHYPSNMGHVIGDDLFPLFNLMSSFGMLVDDAQLIISRNCQQIFADNPKKAEQCDFFIKMLTPGLTSKEYLAATTPDFVQRVRGGDSGSSSDLVCFEQLLAGSGPYGFQQSLGKASSWWSYHAFYLNNLGVNPNRTPKKHRITVSIKKGKRALANNDELVTYLKKTFPTYEIDAIELKSLGGWKKELEYLLDTTILITPCGGVSMSAMFMPHNSAMIIVDYFNLKKNVSFGMEEKLWTNLGYVRPFHYPFTIDEVELPPDRKRTDYQDMRDWGQVRVDMSRMDTIVRAAISHVDNFMVLGQE